MSNAFVSLALGAGVILFVLHPSSARAYSRPDAYNLSGLWEIAPCSPLKDVVADRALKPDWPKLNPTLDEVLFREAAPAANSKWQGITVPCAWEQVLGIDYNGAGWYRRSIDAPEGWGPDGAELGERYWIEFDAVSCSAGVWLNGQWLGGHVGDYSRWRVETTTALRAGQNELLVYVDELPGHITQGFPSMIGPHHGGIWQDVRLYRSTDIAILPDGVQVKADSQSGKVEFRVGLDGASALLDLRPSVVIFCKKLAPEEGDAVYISTFDQSIAKSVRLSAGRLSFTCQLEPQVVKLWSPDAPYVYEAAIMVEGPDGYPLYDSVRQCFAFRTIETLGSDLLLNGQRVNFRSALNWAWYPRIVSPAPPLETIRDEFRQIKALGFNAETVCLVVMPDYYYDLADEEGILLWQEYPTWHSTFEAKDAPTYLREFGAFMHRDRNHPSIVLRSMSCEAGVAERNCMTELYELAKRETEAPAQDNTSWFWLSNLEIADWYDEHNYYTNPQWLRYLTTTLPNELAQHPPKPFLIGESIIASTWQDTDAYEALLNGASDAPRVAGGLSGIDAPSRFELAPTGEYPYWFPRSFESARQLEVALRERYNKLLPAGKDIVRDWLMPMSYKYALEFRRFQLELMRMDPRYTGYTINVVRDMPLLRAGLLDDFGRARWTGQDWAWHGEHTRTPVVPGDTPEVAFPKLTRWKSEWDGEINRDANLVVLADGYLDIAKYFAQWPNARVITSADLPGWLEQAQAGDVAVTSVLTHDLVDFVARGGRVLLLASKWPGALNTVSHMYWRDQPFVSPFGPWSADEAWRVLDLQQFDLCASYSQAIPVEDLGIADEVEPLFRLLDTHDQAVVQRFDQILCTRVGDGLLIACSFDCSNQAGQWVLGELCAWGRGWSPGDNFPMARMEVERLHSFAVKRANGVLGLEDGWRFSLDETKQGESLGYQQAAFDDSNWDSVRTGVGWESLGYSYNGMAWYRKRVSIPADWAGCTVRLVADGVDDAYTVWVNGQAVATHGSFTDHEATIWLKQTVTDISAYLRPGESNSIVLQVVDITGQGGVWRPIYLTAD